MIKIKSYGEQKKKNSWKCSKPFTSIGLHILIYYFRCKLKNTAVSAGAVEYADYTSNETTCWPWVATLNASERDPGGWGVRDTATELVKWFETLHFDSLWARQATREARFDQSAGHVKPYPLYDCPHRILQIALVANKYLILFYLKVARRRRMGVNFAEIEIVLNDCQRLIYH